MSVADLQVSAPPKQRRKFPRFEVQCRAKIHIGMRHYAGYLHNIGQGGAKLRMISPIRKPGKVILRLPDLPAMPCELRWTDSYNAGVAFEVALPRKTLSEWAKGRLEVRPQTDQPDRDVAELEIV